MLDYVIVRSSDLKFVKKKCAIRQAECSNDHRHVVSIIVWKLRPRPRRSGPTRRKLNCEALQNNTTRNQFQTTLGNTFSDTAEDPPLTPTNIWERFSRVVRSAAEETISFHKKKYRNYFDENREDYCKLAAEKNNAPNNLVRNPSSTGLHQKFIDLRSFTQRELITKENAWWTDLAAEFERYANDNDTRNFDNSIKQVYGSTTRSITPVRSMDGRMLINDAEGISHRWAEHSSVLLNGGFSPDHYILDDIPQ